MNFLSSEFSLFDLVDNRFFPTGTTGASYCILMKEVEQTIPVQNKHVGRVSKSLLFLHINSEKHMAEEKLECSCSG